MKARRISSGGQRYLEISFFKAEELSAGEMLPKIRTFFCHSDYISRCRDGRGWKWRTGARGKLVRTWREGTCVSASGMDERGILSWFGAKDGSVTDAVDAFQEQVMGKRLEERHRKEKEKMEAIMSAVPEMPAGFMEWVRQSFMEESRYFMYRYSGRKRQTGVCTHCGREVSIDRKLVRHRGKVVCPECGKKVTALAWGKMQRSVCDGRVTAFFQKAGDELLLRFFYIEKKYRKCSPGICEILKEEYFRMFYENGKWRSYECRAVGYQQGKGWKEETQGRYVLSGSICPLRLRETLRGTPFFYSGLEAFAAPGEDRMLDIPKYLDTWMRHNCLEKLVKCGFYSLVLSCWSTGTEGWRGCWMKGKAVCTW